MRRLPLAALALAAPGFAGVYVPPSAADLSGYATIGALNAATSGLTKSVAGNAPDASGNVALPTSFSGVTMSNTTLTGSVTINGLAPVLTVNGATPVSGNVTLAIPSIAGLATTASVTSAISTAIAPLATSASVTSAIGIATTGLATTASVSSAVAGLVSSVNGIAPTAGAVAVPIGSVGNVSGLAYFHRYSNVTLTVPAVALGGTGTGTATVSGTAAGDQCFVAPTSATGALGYIMGSGWVTTAGTVKVALAAPSILAISSGTISVNMLCAQ